MPRKPVRVFRMAGTAYSARGYFIATFTIRNNGWDVKTRTDYIGYLRPVGTKPLLHRGRAYRA